MSWLSRWFGESERRQKKLDAAIADHLTKMEQAAAVLRTDLSDGVDDEELDALADDIESIGREGADLLRYKTGDNWKRPRIIMRSDGSYAQQDEDGDDEDGPG